MSFLFSVMVALLVSIGGQMDNTEIKRESAGFYDNEKQISGCNTTCTRTIPVTGFRRISVQLSHGCFANFLTAHAIAKNDLIAVSLEVFECDDEAANIQVFSGQNGVLFFMNELKCGRANTMPLLLTGSQWIMIVAEQGPNNHEKRLFELKFSILTYRPYFRNVDVYFKNSFPYYNLN